MANPDHLEVLKGGSPTWNRWRAENPQVIPDLVQAHLREARLSGANLTRADLRLTYFGRADLSGADLTGANLSETSVRHGDFKKARLDDACLIGADLTRADFNGASLVRADVSRAYLHGANFSGVNLSHATLVNADLRLAVAVDANMSNADLSGSQVYGISAWNVSLEGAEQRDLVITPSSENPITTDNLQVAQFLYLLLNNRAIRDVIETVGRKAVLILGRFTEERKPVLETIRQTLRGPGLVPILFDFQGPRNRDFTETIAILANLSRAIIADLTDARSVPQELMTIIPNLPSVPVQPLIARSSVEYSMFEHFRKYPWVRATVPYSDSRELLEWLHENLEELLEG